MDDKKLSGIRHSLLKEQSQRKRLYILLAVILVFSCASFFIMKYPYEKTSLVCEISKEQKELLKNHINYIAASGKVSDITLFKHLKNRFGYETISKIPCAQYKEVNEYLIKLSEQF